MEGGEDMWIVFEVGLSLVWGFDNEVDQDRGNADAPRVERFIDHPLDLRDDYSAASSGCLCAFKRIEERSL